MDEAARMGRPPVDDGPRSTEQIRRDIEQTREELGETVEALAAKTDVKAQARSKVDDTKQRAREKVEAVREKVAPHAGAVREKVAPQSSNGSPGRAPDPAALQRRIRRAAAQNPVTTRLVFAFTAGMLIGVLVARD